MKKCRNDFPAACCSPSSSHGRLVLARLFIWSVVAMFLVCPNPILATESEDLLSTDPLDEELLENLSLLSEVLAHIQQAHLESPEPKKLMYGAIRGMLRTLDPYSQFFDPESYGDFRTESRGAYGGLGMVIGIRQDRLTIISPFKDTPAYEAGVQSGDTISLIEEEPTAAMTVDEAVERLRGEPGTQVTITLLREGENEPLEVTITRDVIRFRSVESKILGGDVGYIRINQFRDTTGADVDKAFESFDSQELRGMILDLRSNPGGLLSSAVEVASDFLEPDQLIVYTEGTNPREDLLVRPDQKQKDYPLVVLVNGGSASGSEIVAAAIKDHGRGIVLGRKTFGKASVQKVIQLSGDHAIKLTVAHYYSPSGVNIHKIGIAPDIEVPWFSQSENKILTKLREHEKIKAFIDENGDDVLTKLDHARHASREDREAIALLRKYRRLVDALSKEEFVLGNAGINLAIARETENDVDEYEHDPQILAAVQQLKLLELFQTKLK